MPDVEGDKDLAEIARTRELWFGEKLDSLKDKRKRDRGADEGVASRAG